MIGASLTEVWGSDFNTKPKKDKKKKNKTKPLSPEEMDSELLITDSERPAIVEDRERLQMLRDDRQDHDMYQRINPNVVTRRNPYGGTERRPQKIEEDPDYQEFLEFKNRKGQLKEDNVRERAPLIRVNESEQLNELLLYVFTGFFLLILYDNIYRLGKNSY
jgi:hypothetical protein